MEEWVGGVVFGQAERLQRTRARHAHTILPMMASGAYRAMTLRSWSMSNCEVGRAIPGGRQRQVVAQTRRGGERGTNLLGRVAPGVEQDGRLAARVLREE